MNFSPYYVEAPARFRSMVDENYYVVYSQGPTHSLCKLLTKSRPSVDNSADFNQHFANVKHIPYPSSRPHASVRTGKHHSQLKSDSTLTLTVEPEREKVKISIHEKDSPAPGKDGRPRVLVKKRPPPKLKAQPRVPVQQLKKKKIKTTYSNDTPYQTTFTGSLLSLATGIKKEIWQDPEITGEYISFLPSLKETKDKQEIFRRQGVVRGYPKRTLPHYEEAVAAAVKERKRAQSVWRFFRKI